MTPAEEEGRTYWQGRMDRSMEDMMTLLRTLEEGQLRRHQENKERLAELVAKIEALDLEVREMREWRSYVKGMAVAWAAGVSLFFNVILEVVRYTMRGKP